MKTTCDFVDDIRRAYNLDSDGKAANKLGVTRSAISTYRTGKSCFEDDTAIRAAAPLNLPTGYVLACIREERSKSETARDAWSQVAKALAPTPQTSNPTDQKPRDGVCYVKQRRYYGNIPRTWRVAPPRRFSPSPKNTPSMILA